jgi:hypothetical protein
MDKEDFQQGSGTCRGFCEADFFTFQFSCRQLAEKENI